MEKIVLIGAGGHAKTIVDSIERAGQYEIAGFIANGEIGQEIYRGYKIIGHDEDMHYIYESGVHNAILAMGCVRRSDVRKKLYPIFKNCGFDFPVIIDPTAVVAEDAVIGEGTYIGRNAVVNVDVRIGINCIINTSAVIEHECTVADFTHIAVAAVLGGQVSVGKNTLIGANATILQCCNVGNDCVVGAGSLVRKDVGDMVCIVGNNEQLGGVME